LCHSERSEEPRIFLGANYCTLNHGSTAATPAAPRFGASANPGFFASHQNDTERFARNTKKLELSRGYAKLSCERTRAMKGLFSTSCNRSLVGWYSAA
jgi:hypothetical protein